MEKDSMKMIIEELAERGLEYTMEPNTSLKTNLKKIVCEAYLAGMEAAQQIYSPTIKNS